MQLKGNIFSIFWSKTFWNVPRIFQPYNLNGHEQLLFSNIPRYVCMLEAMLIILYNGGSVVFFCCTLKDDQPMNNLVTY